MSMWMELQKKDGTELYIHKNSIVSVEVSEDKTCTVIRDCAGREHRVQDCIDSVIMDLTHNMED